MVWVEVWVRMRDVRIVRARRAHRASCTPCVVHWRPGRRLVGNAAAGGGGCVRVCVRVCVFACMYVLAMCACVSAYICVCVRACVTRVAGEFVRLVVV